MNPRSSLGFGGRFAVRRSRETFGRGPAAIAPLDAFSSAAVTTITYGACPRDRRIVRPAAARMLESALVLAAALAVSACSLHLHSPENAKRARAALDTYEKLTVDSVVTTGRSNIAELSKAQLETRQRVSEVAVKTDLIIVIGAEPRERSGLGPGWDKLVPATQAALEPYELLKDGEYSDPRVVISIRNRASNERHLANHRRTYLRFVESYRAANPAPGTQDTKCPAVLATVPEEGTSPPQPPNEPPLKWEFYKSGLAPLCRVLKEFEDDLKQADDALRRNREYREIAEQLTQLEGELSRSEADAKALLQEYEAAKKKLVEAEQVVATLSVAQQTAAAKAEVEAAQAKLGKVVGDSQQLAELVQVQIKTDLLETILSNAKALSGDPKAVAAKPTQRLLAVIKKYPDIAGRLRAADVPPVNVLLLELAIQRLHYRRLQAGRDAKKDIIAIWKLQRDAYADSAAAWISVMDKLILLQQKDQAALPQALFEAFNSSMPIGRQRIAEVLVAYAVAELFTEDRMNVLNAQLRDRYRAQSLEMSEIAVVTWNDLIRAPLSEITAYHEGGITSEEIARLVNALGITAIAVGVYQ